MAKVRHIETLHRRPSALEREYLAMSIRRVRPHDPSLSEPAAEAFSDRPPLSGPRFARIDVAFLLSVLRRQARTIATVVLTGMIATYGALQLIPPRFVASATLLLDPRQTDPLATGGSQTGASDDLMLIESQIELLRSTRIAARVLDSLSPADRAPFIDDLQELSNAPRTSSMTSNVALLANTSGDGDTPAITSDAEIARSSGNQSPESVLELLKGLTVERKGRSYLVEVRFTDRNSERAASIANSFVSAFVADQLDAKYQSARAANNWLDQRIQEIGGELAVAELRQQRFQVDQDLVEVGDMTLLERELADTALQLVAARAGVAEAEAKLDQVRSLSGDPQQLLSLETSIRSPVINEFRRQTGDVERRIGQGISQYGTEHPTVLAAQAELERLNQAIRDEVGRTVKSGELALEVNRGKAKLLENVLADLKNRSKKLGRSQVELGELRREIEASSSLYATLLRRYKETKAQEKLQSANAHVVSYASPAAQPSFPKSNLILLLAGLCWFGVGAGTGLAREMMLPPLRTAADVEHATGVECVATVPVVDPNEEGTSVPAGRNLLGPMHWCIDDHTDPGFNQAIFGIRQWVIGHVGNTSQVVLVTGVDAADGSSTVALQLALYAARTGLKVALVDADLRSSGISETLWTGAGVTFDTAVMQAGEPQNIPARELGPGVRFFPSSHDRGNSPLDVLGSRGMGRWLDHLRSQFDLVVIDTAAMSDVVDAEALAEHADSALLVVKAGKVYEDKVTSAIGRLSQRPGLPTGVVLNMAGVEHA
jgi:uncharacterized protein involved in exopolysaccharide biosynthesis